MESMSQSVHVFTNITDLLGDFEEEQYQDEGRVEFIGMLLTQLPHLTSWEQSFVKSLSIHKSFSPKQRVQVDRLCLKYPHYYT